MREVVFINLPFGDVQRPPIDFLSLFQHIADLGNSARFKDINIEYFHALQCPPAVYQAAESLPLAQVKALAASHAERVTAFVKNQLAECLSSKGNVLVFNMHLGSLECAKLMPELFDQLDKNHTTILVGNSLEISGERGDIEAYIAHAWAIEGPAQRPLEAIITGRATPNTPGLGKWENGKAVFRNPKVPCDSFYAYPLPNISKAFFANYVDKKLPVRSSIGCTRRCFTCHETLNHPFSFTKRPEAVVAYLKRSMSEHDIREFIFVDHALNASPEYIAAIAEGIIDAGLDISWTARLSVDRTLDYLLAKKLRKSGCSGVVVNLMSGSDNVLGLMNAGFTKSDAADFLNDLHNAGIPIHIELIVGFPGEDEADLQTTREFLYFIKDRITSVCRLDAMCIYPTSKLEKQPDLFGVYLPEGNHAAGWTHGQNNTAYREHIRSEMAKYISQLGIRGTEFLIKAPIKGFVPGASYDLLLTTLPPSGFGNPPIGLAYLQEYMNANGVNSLVYDFNIHLYNVLGDSFKLLWHVENKNYWSSSETAEFLGDFFSSHLDKYVADVLAVNPKMIGFSVCDPKERITIEAIRRIRKHNTTVKIILGGPACFTTQYRNLFVEQIGDLIDGYCVVGEGEPVLLEAMQRVLAGESLVGIKGLMVYTSKADFWYEPRPYIKDLDSIPQPTYRNFELSQYREGHGICIEWSRGCVTRCKFCKAVQICGTYRCRSPESKVKELKYLSETFGTKKFTVVDLLLNGDLQNLEESCESIAKAKLNVRWNAEGLPLPGMTDKICRSMAKAGCHELYLGVEAGSDNTLKLMNKYYLFNTAIAQEVLRRVHLAGIRTSLFWQVGYPGETDEDFMQSYQFVERNAEYIDQLKSINSTAIITDTPLHRQAPKFGITLPERDYHVLWSMPGNDIEVRRNRIKTMLRLCKQHNISVMETNLGEGKQYDATPLLRSEVLNDKEKMDVILRRVNKLESFNDLLGEESSNGDVVRHVGPSFKAIKERFRSVTRSVHFATNGHLRDDEELRNKAPSDGTLPLGTEDIVRAKNILQKSPSYLGPKYLEIDLVKHCNFDCVGCWTHSPHLPEKNRTRQELPYDVIEKLLDHTCQKGLQRVQLSGSGEPMLHTRFMEVIRAIKARNIGCSLVTNFSLATPEQIDEMVRLKLDVITISLWAESEETFVKAYPNTPMHFFHKVRANIRELIAAKVRHKSTFPVVKLYPIISAVNYDKVYDFFRMGREYGVDQMEFTVIDLISGATESLKLLPEHHPAIADALRRINEAIDSPLVFTTSAMGKTVSDDDERDDIYRYLRTTEHEGFRYRLEVDLTCAVGRTHTMYKGNNIGKDQLVIDFTDMNCTVCSKQRDCDIAHKPTTVPLRNYPRDFTFRMLRRMFEKRAASIPPFFRNDFNLFERLAAKNFGLSCRPVVYCPVGKASTRFGLARNNKDRLIFDFSSADCAVCPIRSSCSVQRTPIEFLPRGQLAAATHYFATDLFALRRFGTFIKRVNDMCGVESAAKGEEKQYAPEKEPCYAGYTYARVNVKGEVIPCCKGSEYPLGSLHEFDFQTHWHSAKMDDFRRMGTERSRFSERAALIPCHTCDNRGLNLEMGEKLKQYQRQCKKLPVADISHEQVGLLLDRLEP